MERLEELKQEMKIIESNIKRVEKYIKDNKDDKYRPYSSQVFGELKHRLIAFKRSINIITNMSTNDLFE